MKKSLVLSMLAAVVLTGCGGGGGGGGGSSSPAPVIKYNLQFVEFADAADAPSDTCTLFDTNRQTSGMESYARLASDVKVKVYDAKGDLVKDLTVSNKGLLGVSANDVPDGGYVSVIDSPDDDIHNYKVLSVQKSMLNNMMVAVKRPQGAKTDCYKGEKETRIIKTGKASVYSPSSLIPSSFYSFNSYQTSILQETVSFQVVDIFENETVLSRAYNGAKNLVGFKFVSTLTDVKDPSITPEPLSAVDETYSWTNGLIGPDNQIKTLSVRLNKNDYSYPWINVDLVTNPTFTFAYTSIESSWNYNMVGSSFKWNFIHNEALSTSLHFGLPSELPLTDTPSIIAQTGADYKFKAEGINSTITRLQRSAYYKEFKDVDGKTRTLEHSIYSEIESGNEAVIPKLGLTSLDPIGATNIKVNILSSDTITSDLKTFFMRENAANDLVSVVLSPAKTVAHDKVKYMSNYTLLSR